MGILLTDMRVTNKQTCFLPYSIIAGDGYWQCRLKPTSDDLGCPGAMSGLTSTAKGAAFALVELSAETLVDQQVHTVAQGSE